MKKQKNYYKKFWILAIIFSFLAIITAISYAAWNIKKELANSKANSPWANGSIQEFTPNWTSWTNFATFYNNKKNNSSIIWNFLSWYYYDSVYWFFKLDWSSDESKNVRIVDSTDKCPWYWYKLGWYAYSENFWFVDFSYDNNIFVYYCIDNTVSEWGYLKWYAYLENIWFQNFDWIKFSIKPEVVNNSALINDENNFVNDNTEITNPEFENDSDVINWNIQYLNDTKWSTFYIIK